MVTERTRVTCPCASEPNLTPGPAMLDNLRDGRARVFKADSGIPTRMLSSEHSLSFLTKPRQQLGERGSLSHDRQL